MVVLSLPLLPSGSLLGRTLLPSGSLLGRSSTRDRSCLTTHSHNSLRSDIGSDSRKSSLYQNKTATHKALWYIFLSYWSPFDSILVVSSRFSTQLSGYLAKPYLFPHGPSWLFPISAREIMILIIVHVMLQAFSRRRGITETASNWRLIHNSQTEFRSF